MFSGGSDDPFAQMHRQMQERHSHMMQHLGGMMQDPFFGDFGSHHASSRQQQGRSHHEPTIEEVHDDEQYVAHEPIVEEPDDDPNAHCNRRSARGNERHERRHHDHNRHHSQRGHEGHTPFGDLQLSPFGSFGDPFAGFFGNMGFPSMRDMMSMPPTGGSGQYYSYSSSYSCSGPNGPVYEETKSHRRGPGGVMEERRTVRDGRTGEEQMQLTRGLHDKRRTLERKRRNEGKEERNEVLHGIKPEEAQAFDKQWQETASQMFGGDGRHGRRLRGNRQGSQQTTPAQLGYGEDARWI